jgi:hypothetical protein
LCFNFFVEKRSKRSYLEGRRGGKIEWEGRKDRKEKVPARMNFRTTNAGDIEPELLQPPKEEEPTA